VLEHTPELTHVTLQVPTLHDSKVQGWYSVRSGQVIPDKMLSYGPGFAFVVIPLSLAAGVVSVLAFALIVRPRRQTHEKGET